ncbi:hypothetical protein CHS0354_030520 [Potamilus streckersoni]|nr:hypothetical protein CHS0354_030520 [Potamilus streckersoni]
MWPSVVGSVLFLSSVEFVLSGKWHLPKQYRQRDESFLNDALSYGPNVCAIQEVYRTGEKFYPDCVKSRLRKICDRPTFVRYQCCGGYNLVQGEQGCPAVRPLKNVRETIKDLKLNEFSKLLTNTELERQLIDGGAYTVFVPEDEAFEDLTYDQKQRLFPWTYQALSLVHYHIVHGWRNTSTVKEDMDVPTLYYGLKPVRIGRNPIGVYTVNCARIIKPNILAANGIIHVIDKVMSPFDLLGNLTDVIMRDSSQFSNFINVLYTAKMVTYLRDGGMFTIFAPNNYAFSRLPDNLKERILKDQRTAEAVVRHHVAEGIYCGESVLITSGLKTMDGSKVTFRCRKNGYYVDNVKVISSDNIAGNGVFHTIDKLLIPRAVKTMDDLARDLNLNKFLQLSHEAGLLDLLESRSDMTLFAPTDEAFNALPTSFQTALLSEPVEMEQLFEYHLVKGKITQDDMIGDKYLETESGKKMKISVHRNGILVNDGEIITPNEECSNGIIHVIDKVLIPPEYDLLMLITRDKSLQTFLYHVENSKLQSLLLKDDAHYTVFAPTEEAFSKKSTHEMEKLYDNIELLRKNTLHHIVKKIIISRGIPANSMLQLQSMQGEPITISQDDSGNFYVNKHAKIVEVNIIATNGILFKIDRLLQCMCNSSG